MLKEGNLILLKDKKGKKYLISLKKMEFSNSTEEKYFTMKFLKKE